MSKQLLQPNVERQDAGRGQKVRILAGTVGAIAVLALLGMETRGLMHFGKCDRSESVVLIVWLR